MSSKHKILVLEDDQLSQELLADGLEDYYDYEVRRCSNLDEANAVLEIFTPDLLVLDLVIGDDRLAVVKWVGEIRSIEKFAKVPVLFVTAYSEKEELVARVKEIERSDLLRKPFEYDGVVERMKHLLSG